MAKKNRPRNPSQFASVDEVRRHYFTDGVSVCDPAIKRIVKDVLSIRARDRSGVIIRCDPVLAENCP
jgi:hypothetical protein